MFTQHSSDIAQTLQRNVHNVRRRKDRGCWFSAIVFSVVDDASERYEMFVEYVAPAVVEGYGRVHHPLDPETRGAIITDPP